MQAQSTQINDDSCKPKGKSYKSSPPSCGSLKWKKVPNIVSLGPGYSNISLNSLFIWMTANGKKISNVYSVCCIKCLS